MMGLRHDEIDVGRVFELGSYDFTEANMASFANRFAPVPMHADEGAMAAGLFGKRIAVGFHVCSAWMACFVRTNMDARTAMQAKGIDMPEPGAGFGLSNIRWLKPVHAGDRIGYRCTITFKRVLNSKPQWSMISMLNEGLRDGQLVMRFDSSMLVAR